MCICQNVQEIYLLFECHKLLSMRKLSLKWVKRWFTPNNKCIDMTTSQQCLALFNRNPWKFLPCTTTNQETIETKNFTNLN